MTSRAPWGERFSSMNDYYTTIDSPVGELLLVGDGRALRLLQMARFVVDPRWERRDRHFTDVREQLAEYFDGARRSFDVSLALTGGPFELRVWKELLQIPYGSTVSYGQLARRLGRPDAARAVGIANARNPVALVVPCHRVIGADGALTGYGGGLERKRFLLDLEAGVLPLVANPLSSNSEAPLVQCALGRLEKSSGDCAANASERQ